MTGHPPQRTSEDEDARRHMARNPDHEMIVGADDQWHCLTCEHDDGE